MTNLADRHHYEHDYLYDNEYDIDIATRTTAIHSFPSDFIRRDDN